MPKLVIKSGEHNADAKVNQKALSNEIRKGRNWFSKSAKVDVNKKEVTAKDGADILNNCIYNINSVLCCILKSLLPAL